MLLQHPESGTQWDEWLISRYANADDPPLTFEEAVDDLLKQGFVKASEDTLEGNEVSERLPVVILQEVKHAIEESLMRVVANAATTKSPYFTKEEAAAYLKTSVDGIYGRVERGHLKRCPGVREYLFTQEMLDESVMIRRKRKGPR